MPLRTFWYIYSGACMHLFPWGMKLSRRETMKMHRRHTSSSPLGNPFTKGTVPLYAATDSGWEWQTSILDLIFLKFSTFTYWNKIMKLSMMSSALSTKPNRASNSLVLFPLQVTKRPALVSCNVVPKLFSLGPSFSYACTSLCSYLSQGIILRIEYCLPLMIKRVWRIRFKEKLFWSIINICTDAGY